MKIIDEKLKNGICMDWLTCTVEYNREKKCVFHMSLVMRKPAFCICENKDADQLRGDRKSDQRLCFRYIASKIPLLPKYKIPSL